MPNNKSYIIIFLTSIIFSQNIWTGNSVSTSDNLDAFSLNPAGFGLDRGEQEVFISQLIMIDLNLSRLSDLLTLGIY